FIMILCQLKSTHFPYTNALPISTFTSTPGNGFVSRTGYNEKDLVDYHAYNLKTTVGLGYKINSNTEATLLGYWGTGTTVYTGAEDRKSTRLNSSHVKISYAVFCL